MIFYYYLFYFNLNIFFSQKGQFKSPIKFLFINFFSKKFINLQFKFLIFLFYQLGDLTSFYKFRQTFRFKKLKFYQLNFKYNYLKFKFDGSFLELNDLNWLNHLILKNKLLIEHKFKFYTNVKNYENFLSKKIDFGFFKNKFKLNWTASKLFFSNIRNVLINFHYKILIKIKKNNIFLIFIDTKGVKVLFFISAGLIFRGKKKRTYLTGRFLSKTFLKLIIRFLFKRYVDLNEIQFLFSIDITKSLNFFLIKSILIAFRYYNFPVFMLQDVSTLPHSFGGRLKKLRRL